MCPSAGKEITTQQLLYLSTWFPRLIIRLEERDLRAVMLLRKRLEASDNATAMRKGKQEQRQQQCHCCYICQHYSKPKHPRKACCMDMSYTYFDKFVCRKVNFFVKLVQTHYLYRKQLFSILYHMCFTYWLA